MTRSCLALLGLALASCQGANQADSVPPTKRDAAATPNAQAGPDAGSTAGGFHLDPDPTPPRGRGSQRRGNQRPIELVIRSTPPGATASVDGRAIGTTPTYWEGVANGQNREFTFVLPGYAVARYRFVPTQSGIVHGSLTRLVTAPDAGN